MMKMEYSFNANQLKQYNELSSQKYAALWNGAIYGNENIYHGDKMDKVGQI